MSIRSRALSAEESADSQNTLPCSEVDVTARLESAPEVRRLSSGQAGLIVCSGPGRGTAFELDGYAVVGRHALCDVVLDDITVSRHHAEIERNGATHTICDLRSLNGTYVNGERVEHRELTSGDTLQIGRFQLVFVTNQ